MAPKGPGSTTGPGWPWSGPAGRGFWLLARRRLTDGELAFYACFGPAGTSLDDRFQGVSMVVGDQGPGGRLAGVVVVPDRGGQRQDALQHLRAAPVMRPGVPDRLAELLQDLHDALEHQVGEGSR